MCDVRQSLYCATGRDTWHATIDICGLLCESKRLESSYFSMSNESGMRTLTLALTAVTVLGVTAFTASGMLVASTDPIGKQQIHSGGLGAAPQGGLLHRGHDRLAKSDMSGTGGGGMMGNMRGDMMGKMGGR
jgi:hypothetical protein